MNLLKKILVVLLCLNLFLLAGRFWQEAAAGSTFTPVGNGDVNADGDIDLSDPIYLLTYLFQGGPAPVAIAQGGGLEEKLEQLEARIASIESRTTLSDLRCADGEVAKWSELTGRWVCAVDEVIQPPDEFPGFTFVESNTEGYPEYTHDASGILFVLLPGGTFDMGSPSGEADEGPVHPVTLSPFLIAKYEVTQAEYEDVMTGDSAVGNPAPSSNIGANLPVEGVSWDALHVEGGFLERTGLSLPSEAQWEYAARAGTTAAFSFGDSCNVTTCDECALAENFMWWCGNSDTTGSGGTTHEVGVKQANQFGLHDMHGNVFEWCEDVYNSSFYDTAAALGPDPVSLSGSVGRVIRGGSFLGFASRCRSALRDEAPSGGSGSSIGFRPAMPLP
ncbi:MAG: formylglycine-generating enzyme family protein [Planctomycetes bacterium]|nr:formylglycine-generating enzyme family protein [Planctomycetota bacterium]